MTNTTKPTDPTSRANRRSQRTAPPAARRRPGEKIVPTRSAWDQTLALLARREHTAHELRTALRRRGHEEPAITTAIERAQQMGYQDDTRTATLLARQGVLSRRGPRRIAADFANKGLPREAVRAALERVNTPSPGWIGSSEDTAETPAIDWIASAREAARRRFGAGPDDEAVRRRLSAFLARRGFEMDVIGALLRERGRVRTTSRSVHDEE